MAAMVIASAAAAGGVWLAGTLTGADPDRWWRPAIMATGAPLVIACWHVVARPNARWRALVAAVVTTAVLYPLLYRLVFDEVRSPWDGVLSFTAAGWVGTIAYVALTHGLVPLRHHGRGYPGQPGS